MPPASPARLASTGIPVVISGGVVSWALATSHWSWWGIATMVPTNPEQTSFGDLKAVLATALCMEQGVDYTLCDPYGRPFTPYVVPPARVFAALGLDLDDSAWIGGGLAVIYVLTIGGLGWLLQRHWRSGTAPLLGAQALIGVAAVTAPAMLGIERGQVEIVVLAFTTAGLALLAGASRGGRAIGAVVAVLAVAGKYFAIGLFAPFVRRGRPNAAALVALAVSVAFLVLSWTDLQQAVSTSRAGDPATSQSQFGAAALLATALSTPPITGIPSPTVVEHWTTVTVAAWLLVLAAVAVAAVAIPRAASTGLDRLPVPRALLIGGLGVLALPYLLGASHDYRQVFLLPALVGALAWLSASSGGARVVAWTLVLAITASLATGASMIPTPSGLLGADEFLWPKAALVIGDVALLVALAIGGGLWLQGWRRHEV